MAVVAARAKTCFLAASDLVDPAERAAFPERERGRGAELPSRVEPLLRASDPGALGLKFRSGAAVDSAPRLTHLVHPKGEDA